MRIRNPRAGLTLLETLIALAIMAMMAVMVSGGLATGARVMARSGAEGALLQQAMARREVRGWIELALTAPVPGDARPLFAGDGRGFSVLVVPEDAMFWAGAATTVSVAVDGIATATGRTRDGRPVTQMRRLAPDGHAMQVRYWGRLEAMRAPLWHEEWPGTAGMPDLVKLTFSGPGVDVPDLTIRPAKARFLGQMSLTALVPEPQVAR